MIFTQMTNGFGNNLFQYVAARLLADHHGVEVRALPPSSSYYAVGGLQSLGIKFASPNEADGYAPVNINENTYLRAFNEPLPSRGYLLRGYFEDFRFYINALEQIKSWFPPLDAREDNALVIHIRTGDRLFMKNEFYRKPQIENYLAAIEKFRFDELHVATDMPKWAPVSESELQQMRFHVDTPPENCVPIKDSVNYFNSLVEGLSQFNPIVKTRAVVEDFNFMRTFKNILFEHGTLSWWAAVLSNAEQVGVYGPWRPWKGDKNKNLSQIPLPGWFKWE